MKTIVLLVLWGLAVALTGDAHAAQGDPSTPACCSITTVDPRSGTVTARDAAGRQTFQFIAPQPLVPRLRPGLKVWVDARTQVVSVEGAASCCKLVTAAAPAPTAPAPLQPAVKSAPAPSQTSAPPVTTRAASVASWFAQNGGRFHVASDPSRPVVLLIHGLHSSGRAWTRPADDPGVGGYYYDHRREPSRVKATKDYPGVGIFKEGKSERAAGQINAQNWFDYLVGQGFTVATWSQPGETFEDAWPSATKAFETLLASTQGPIALIGHSRGGLVARRLLKEKVLQQSVGAGRVRWAFTLHSPHAGSELAKGPEILLDELGLKCAQIQIPNDWLTKVKNMCKELMNELAARLAKPGSRELTPGGPVLGPLAQGEAPVPGVSYHTFGGTSPTYIRYYLWYFTPESAVPQYKCDPAPPNCKQYFKWEAVPHAISGLSPMYDVVRDVVPEIKIGAGDGLVADARSRLPFATHATNSLNHAEILWSRAVQQRVASLVSGGLRR